MPDPHSARFPQVIDSTMLVTFKSCPQKFNREYIERRATTSISPDLHAGGALARALETYRRAFYRDKLNADDCLMLAFREFTLFWGDYEPPEGHNKTFVNTWGAFRYYLDQWPCATDFLQPLMRDGEPAVEFTFALPLPHRHPVSGDPILYCGRFDMLGTTGEPLFIVDEKTTKAFYVNWSSQWQLRTQFLGYTWATRAMGFNTQGAYVRGIAIQKTQYRHLEAICQYADWELERWFEQTCRDIDRMIECWNEGYWDFDLGDSCSQWGGCAYHTLCTSKKPELWYGDYTERLWNPLAQNPTAREEAETPS